ncbi:MAG: cysteine--tRNA ligase [Saprospiraceae bacterium]|nr:cysteine--tRNA ligase [Saprospiraceae bacterium]MDG2419817.1 cysteine--tRNA ligase [Saprospiraceae bacterium]
MKNELYIQNSLTRQKELFQPITDGFIGMYVCGPTVYSDVHIGNCRTFVSFDVIYRYLMHLGFQVRYVRNITDVGHLTDEGEDKMSKGAKLAKLEPMEVAQKYTVGFHDMMKIFNTLPPNIEPRATAHIIEQIDMVQQIIDNGLAYEANGSIYFDTIKFAEEQKVYGKLSGRKIEDLLIETRDGLKNQSEKKHPSDFAIWMKASDEHILRWNSPWSVGFPGWHLECSAMSTKYLGKTFDIHGGGNDLKFPHHENEIAQNHGACGCQPSNYWIHTNMLEMNGRKMSKSDGNTITPQQLFSGDSPHITQAYSPMVVKFFMLQAHYGSTLDITDKGLQDAEKGYRRLMEANTLLQSMEPSNGATSELDAEINDLMDKAFIQMSDDFNTPMAMARLFELVSKVNSLSAGHLSYNDLTNDTLNRLKSTFQTFISDIFGLINEEIGNTDVNGIADGLMQLIIELRQDARENKDWGTSDKIRDSLKELEIKVKDGNDGTTWSKN